jgi:hypothetical protein
MYFQHSVCLLELVAEDKAVLLIAENKRGPVISPGNFLSPARLHLSIRINKAPLLIKFILIEGI